LRFVGQLARGVAAAAPHVQVEPAPLRSNIRTIARGVVVV
jgi:hypothetical protein